ncbi:MAG TPA: CPBP family intramembrane glutamic endopeptidase [Gemmatimonadales bacterium]|nr:CPBP family intramembrane glutamic endopeptidase [Gemmatimonadales bacterium]
MLVALAVGAVVQVAPFATLTWNLRGLAAGIAATAPLLLLLAWCLRTRFGPVARLVRTVEERAAPLFSGGTAGTIALVAALAGLGEEALFRGVMQPALLAHIPAWAAVAVTAAAFGLAHALTLTYAVLATLVGGYLGWLHLASGNLLVPILAHALYDFIALRLLLRVKPTPPRPSS